MIDLYQREIELEDEAVGLGISRYNSERMPYANRDKRPTPESELPPGRELMFYHLDRLAEVISEWVARAGRGAGNRDGLAGRLVGGR